MHNLMPKDYLVRPDAYHLIDVRSDLEWGACHDEKAVHVPLTELVEKAADLPADLPLVLICRTGGRSLRACQLMEPSGLQVFNLAGGMRALVVAQKEKGLISEEECAKRLAAL